MAEQTPMPAWFTALSVDDQAECLSELAVAAGALGQADVGGLEAALVAWKATGEALADPVARQVLTSPLNPADLVEVGPPAPAAGQWVVVLGTHLPYHASACWILRDEDTATRFAEFVTAEIDPAQVMRALDPVAELLNWRKVNADGPSQAVGLSDEQRATMPGWASGIAHGDDGSTRYVP